MMKISLRVKVGLTITTLISLSGVLTAYLVFSSSTHALKDSISTNLSNTASQTMDKIDRYLYERTIDLQSLSGRQQIQNYLAEPASSRTTAATSQLTKQLDEFVSTSATWSEITLVDSQGNLPLPTAGLQNLKSVVANQPAVLKLYAQAAAGQSGYTDAFVIKGHEPIMLFMTPVRNEQTNGNPIVGVLAGELAWQSTLDILRTLQNDDATLVNPQGISLGDNANDAVNDVLSQDLNKSAAFAAAKKYSNGVGVFPGLDNPKASFLTAYVKENGYLDYHGNAWTLILQTPTAAAFSPAHKLADDLVVTYFSILIASIAVFIFSLELQVIKPVDKLRQAAERLANGNFTEQVQISTRDEIGQLARSFNNMSRKLQGAYLALHARTEEAESERRLMQALLDSLPVGVMVVKAPSGEPIMINKAGKVIAGRGLMGPDIDSSRYTETYSVLREDETPYPTEELPLTITLKTNQMAVKDDMLLRRPNGTTVAVRAITSPIRENDGQVHRAVSVFEDITSERELERSREEFFSIASHELRTPLTAIRGNSSMIQKMYGDKLDDPALREMVDDIHESSLRLIEIVNDFLDTSRLEQKHMKYEFQPIDLIAISESVVKEYQVTGSRQHVHLQVDRPTTEPPKVWADTNRVKQIIINLMGNALKFTDHGSVTISFKSHPDKITTIVADTGHGMALEAQQLLFKKFEQTGATVLTRDSVRGTGLGLYISKLLVEQMGGHIRLESSKLGEGTSFSFDLPLVNETGDGPVRPSKKKD